MEHIREDLPPETLLEKITSEALSLLVLGGAGHIPDVAPLEAALPLIAKAWGLPEEALKEKTDRLERGKKLAAGGSCKMPGEKLLESYDGFMTANLLWALFGTVVRLEDRTEREAVYRAAAVLDEALDLRSFLRRGGKSSLAILGRMFRNAVRENDPAERQVIYDKALLWMDNLCARGIQKIA